MAGSLGSLIVNLGLDATEFITGMTKSEYEAKKFARQMEAAGRQAGQMLAAGVAIAAGSLALLTKRSIDAADNLNDLAKKAQISVEAMGGIGFAAQQAGTNAEGAGLAIGKLNIKIAEAAGGGKEAQDAFKAMGISVRDMAGNIKGGDVVLSEIAKKFAEYDEGPNTAALANKVFGKSYQDILPLLQDGGEQLQRNIEYFRKYGGITTEVAKQADEFNDTLTKLGLLSQQFGRALAAELLPSLQAVADSFVDGAENSKVFQTSAAGTADILKTLAKGAIYTAAEFRALGTVIGARAAQLAALARLDFKSAAFIGAEVADDIAAQYAARDKLLAAVANTQATSSTALAGSGGRRRAAPGLGGGGAAGGRSARESEAERYLKSLEEQLARTEELTVLDKVLADIETGRLQLSKGISKELLVDIAIEIDQRTALKKQLEDEARTRETISRDSTRRQESQMAEVARMAEGNEALRNEIALIGADATKRAEQAQAINAVAIARKEEALWAEQSVNGSSAIAQLLENEIRLLRERGVLMAQKGIAEKVEEDAKKAKEFVDSLGMSFASAFEDAIVAGNDLRSVLKGLEQDIIRIVTRKLVTEPLAQSIGTMLGGFGIGGTGGGSSGIFGSLFGSLFTGGSLTGGFSSSAGSAASSAYFGFANGTSYAPGGWAMVGERGPEIVNLPKGSQVIPSSESRAMLAGRTGNVITLHVNVLPGASRASAEQAAAATARSVQRALRSVA